MAEVIVAMDCLNKFFKNRIDPSKEKDYKQFVDGIIRNSDFVYISEIGDIIPSKKILK